MVKDDFLKHILIPPNKDSYLIPPEINLNPLYNTDKLNKFLISYKNVLEAEEFLKKHPNVRDPNSGSSWLIVKTLAQDINNLPKELFKKNKELQTLREKFEKLELISVSRDNKQ